MKRGLTGPATQWEGGRSLAGMVGRDTHVVWKALTGGEPEPVFDVVSVSQDGDEVVFPDGVSISTDTRRWT